MKKRKNLSLSVVFDRAHRLDASGRGLVQIRATYKGKSRYFSTGVHVQPDQWDHKRRRVKNHPLELDYNRLIYGALDRLEEQKVQLMQRMGFCPLDRLSLEGTSSPSMSFTQFCEQELNRPGITEETRRGQRSSLNILGAFRKEIYFQDLDLPFVKSFDRFLHMRGLRLNSVDKHHRFLRRYINLAIDAQHVAFEHNPYKRFKMRTEEPDRVFLTADELKRLEELELTPAQMAMRNVRQVFLLSCYTGLRFGDVTRLSTEYVSETSEGLELHIRMKKGKRSIVSPLHVLFPDPEGGPTKPERMIRKAMRKTVPGRPFFPVSNQHINRELKQLAAMAGITKRLTYHCARRTFGTLLALQVPMHVLAQLMGHTKITTTAIYTRLNGGMVRNELRKVNWNG